MPRSPITPADIVFLGDSLTEAFNLERHFGLPNLRNRGLSGDTTHQVIYRLQEIINAKPKKVFLMIGINDLFWGEEEVTVFQNIVKILETIRENSPDTLLYLQSILPVNETVMFSDEHINLMIFSLNDSLKRWCKKQKVEFLELYGDFLNNQGEMDRRYTYDGVHLAEEGYELWAKLTRPCL